HFAIRTYLVDQGYDGTGNVTLTGTSSGLPTVTLVFASGEMTTGPELIELLRAEKIGDPNGYALGKWLEEIDSSTDKINAPALREPVFQVFWNTDYSVTGAFEAHNPMLRVLNHPPNNSGGFANNPDTKYMILPYSFSFGEILVIRGKMPTHPNTRRGEKTLPVNPQVQY